MWEEKELRKNLSRANEELDKAGPFKPLVAFLLAVFVVWLASWALGAVFWPAVIVLSVYAVIRLYKKYC